MMALKEVDIAQERERDWRELIDLLEKDNLFSPTRRHWQFAIDLTPERASYVLKNFRYDKQRNLRDWKVKELCRAMLRDEYQECEAIFHRTPRKSSLTQAQHRFHAVLESGCTILMPVNVYWVEDDAKVRDAYYRLDRGVIRTMVEALKDPEFANEIGISASDINALARGAWVMAAGFRPNLSRLGLGLRHSIDYREDLIREFESEARRYFSAIAGCSRRLWQPLRRGEVVAVALATLRYESGAANFWSAVSANDGLERGTPEHTLVEFLLSTNSERSGSPGAYSKCVARCWNAWIDGRELRLVKAGESGNPILIRKTPYDGVKTWIVNPDTLALEELIQDKQPKRAEK